MPELQRRLWRIHNAGGRTLIAAHSQGAVIASAALLQKDRIPGEASIALATFGAPMRKLYQWAFPHYFRDETLDSVDTASCVRQWRNFYYLTDYIGAAVLKADSSTEAHSDTEADSETKVDTRLPDPSTRFLIFGEPAPPIGSHSGYWTDRRMWNEIDRMANDLRRHQWPTRNGVRPDVITNR